MEKTESISSLQLIMLILINRLLFGFSFMPTVTIAPANQDAWIADLLSGVLIMIFAIPLLIMATKFPDKSFNEYFEMILGKPIGKCVNFIYAIYLLFISFLTVVLMSDYLLSAVLPETPMYAILTFMLVPCIYASYKGIECIVRSATIFAIITFSIILIYTVLNMNNMDFKVLLPILKDTKLSSLAFGVFNNASRFCDCFLFFFFLPYLKDEKRKSATKLLLIIVTVFTLLNTIIVITTQTVLGIGLAKILKFPYFISIQEVNLFDIIQRIEFFNVSAWIYIFFFKLSSTIFVAAKIFADIFNTKNIKPYIISMNSIIFILITFTSISYYITLKEIIYNYAYLAIFTTNFVLPLIIFTVYLIRRKKLTATI